MLLSEHFNQDAQQVARLLLGKVLRFKHDNLWLSATIIETEAYYLTDKASHASLGFNEKRRALFMPAGTIYMYYARGGDSLNISCQGDGNAVLIKSGYPFFDTMSPQSSCLAQMQANNPMKTSRTIRSLNRLCAGQTLLCKSLGITVPAWNQKLFDAGRFYIEDVGYQPENIIQTTRLGIPAGRDAHLPYRFIDHGFVKFCTRWSTRNKT